MNRQRQRGFTLIEMLVTLLIASIFFSIFASVVLATFETLQSGDERTVAQQNARIGINFIANDIRHATDIAPLDIEAYRDWATGGFPFDENTWDPAYPSGTVEAWPIYRRSVDSHPGDEPYIDLDIDGGMGDGDEYNFFREDGYPYDVRPLAPNRIELAFYGATYYPDTEYYKDIGIPIDLDGNSLSNPTSANTQVMYEHQLVEPLSPFNDIYENEFEGREKEFNMVVNRSDTDSVREKTEFVVYRTFAIDSPIQGYPYAGGSLEDSPGLLDSVSDQFDIHQPDMRQPVADHVINMRFRYWHVMGNEMLEIRFDPDIGNIGGDDPGTDDGYYRYFDIYGNEIYVWYNHDSGEEVPLVPSDSGYGDPEFDNVPGNSFYVDGGIDGDDEYERGILLFEGWRFVNAVSISLKTANNRTLEIYKSSINNAVTSPSGPFFDPTHPDYGMGFIDFGLGDSEFSDATGTLNAYEPLYQGADNLRVSTTTVYGNPVFDFVEPNMNPNYDPNAFTTFQTFVAPPALKEKAEQSVRLLTRGLSHKRNFGT